MQIRKIIVFFSMFVLLKSQTNAINSDFIWDLGKLPFPTRLGKYFIKIGKIRAKIHEIGKIKAIFGLGMTPIYGLKNGQIKSLIKYVFPFIPNQSNSEVGSPMLFKIPY